MRKIAWVVALFAIGCGDDGGGNEGDAAAPGIALSSSSGLRVVRDSAAQLLVEVDRTGGFDGEVILELDGLPAGVGADDVTLPASSSTADFTVNALASAQIGGPLPVTVRARDADSTISAELQLDAYIAGAPGSLDSSFSFDGEVSARISGTELEQDSINGCSVDTEGRVLVAGYGSDMSTAVGWAARFNIAGELDSSFGSAGKLVGFGSPPSYVLDAQPVDGERTILAVLTSVSFLRMLGSDGAVDADFGTGGDTAPLPGSPRPSSLAPFAGGFAYAANNGVTAVDQNGTVAAGFSAIPIPSAAAVSVSADEDGGLFVGTRVIETDAAVTIARLTNTGALDSAFASNGILELPAVLGDDRSYVSTVATVDDGGIGFAYSSIGSAGDGEVVLVRFDQSGTGVAGFGTSGRLVVTAAGKSIDLAVQSDGKILTLFYDPSPSPRHVLRRYNPDGAVDATFGTAGDVELPPNYSVLSYEPGAERLLVCGESTTNIEIARLWL